MILKKNINVENTYSNYFKNTKKQILSYALGAMALIHTDFGKQSALAVYP